MFDLGDMSLIVFISTCSVKTCLERSTEKQYRSNLTQSLISPKIVLAITFLFGRYLTEGIFHHRFLTDDTNNDLCISGSFEGWA